MSQTDRKKNHMQPTEEVTIPNLDFTNKAGLVSLSLQKFEGGYFLRENNSGKKYPISGFGIVGQILSAIGTNLTKAVQQASDSCKIGEIFTMEFQIRKGYPVLFNMAVGSGLVSIDNTGGWRPVNYFGQMMAQTAFVCGLAPEFLSQFPQSQEGWIQFTTHPNVANNPNFNKPVHSNFMNPFGNQGFGQDAFGMDGFSMMPILQPEKNDGSVQESHGPGGTINLK